MKRNVCVCAAAAHRQPQFITHCYRASEREFHSEKPRVPFGRKIYSRILYFFQWFLYESSSMEGIYSGLMTFCVNKTERWRERDKSGVTRKTNAWNTQFIFVHPNYGDYDAMCYALCLMCMACILAVWPDVSKKNICVTHVLWKRHNPYEQKQ